MESNNEEVRTTSTKHRSWTCFKSLNKQNLNNQPLWHVGQLLVTSFVLEKGKCSGPKTRRERERARCVQLIDFEGKIDTFHRLDWINCFTFNLLIGFLLSTLRAYLKINRPINTSVFRKFSCGAGKWRNVSRRLPPPTCHHDSLRSEKSNYAFTDSGRTGRIITTVLRWNHRDILLCLKSWLFYTCRKLETSWLIRKTNQDYKHVVSLLKLCVTKKKKRPPSKAEVMQGDDPVYKSYRIHGPYG